MLTQTTLLSGHKGRGDEGDRASPAAQDCWLTALLNCWLIHQVSFRGAVAASPSGADVLSASSLQHRCEEVCATWLRGHLLALACLAEPKGATKSCATATICLMLLRLNPCFLLTLLNSPALTCLLSANSKMALLPFLCSCC